MLKKLVIAGAVVTAAAGIGVAAPAYGDVGDNLVEVRCIGPNFGEKEISGHTGSITAAVSATGKSVTDLIHSENSTEFEYTCGNSPIAHIGNSTIQIDKADKGHRGHWRD